MDTNNHSATTLGKAIAPRSAAHPQKSGIYALPDSHDAFAARMLLIRNAQSSLDAQYYIWHRDLTGTLLFQELRAAADRGVHVRLLLDDNNTAGPDATLAALDQHPGIEVRLFNPFFNRRFRALGYLTDFFRLNRRMHNKSITADHQATIVGGRNIGDEYFGATDGVLFADLDVLAVGQVVNEVSEDFERYWTSKSSYPTQGLLAPATPAQLNELATAASRVEQEPAATSYLEALRRSELVTSLLCGELAFEWATTRLISDNPAKGLGRAKTAEMMPSKLQAAMGGAARELDIVSPYFVPTRAGVNMLGALTRSNVKVRVLTNSLEATDVTIVHAGYAKRRKAMLKAGIVLYELRRTAGQGRRRSGFRFGGGFRLGSSSASSLHAKTFVSDRSRVFVGSFNFDPRSAYLNTELGFVIDSASLAGNIVATFDTAVPLSSYQVKLTDSGQLIWIERRDDGESNGSEPITHRSEPGSGFWTHVWIWLLSKLPVEWLL